MQNSGPLVILGIAIIAVTAVAILVPYLRRKSDALTAWNMVLFGGSMFMGLGCLAVAYGDFHWKELQWFQPTRIDVQKYSVGAIAFYATLLFGYFVLNWPKQVAAKFLNKWPPASLPLLVYSLVLFGFIALVAPFARQIFFVGPFLFNVSHKVLVFAVVFSFCHWYKNKWQLPLLFLFIVVFVFAALDAMVLSNGRRLLLSVAVAPLICLYWLHWRYLQPSRNLVRLGAVTLLALTVTAFYSTFRHVRNEGTTQRTLTSTISAMKNADLRGAFGAVRNNAFFYFSNYCAHYSLLTIHLLDNDQIQVEPLHSLAFMVAYPIPRIVFPEKPQVLSIRIVTEVLRLPYQTNWGLGIVATGYHEGGVPVIMLYALIIVLLVRLLDDALTRQPDNPFLLAILSTSAPHFAAMIRGDFAVMTTEIAEAIVFAWALGLCGRFFLGTAQTPGVGNSRRVDRLEA